MPKQSFTLVKLQHFKGGFHLSLGNQNSYTSSQKMLHSDTIKSAIFVCALQLYGPQIINQSFLEKFRISSAFPFVRQGGKDLYFFPKPNTRLNISIVEENDRGEIQKIKGEHKVLKKMAFVEKALFEVVINGRSLNLVDGVDIKKGYAHQGWEKEVIIFKNDTYQHVAIDRAGLSDSDTFYIDKRYFGPNAGLFFLLDCADETIKKQLFAALRLLGDSGIGSDRNNGNGAFEFVGEEGNDVISNFELQVPEAPSHELALSLYLPKDKEEIGNFELAQYELTKRGGYITHPMNDEHLTIRKRSIYMFTEGSLFDAQPEKEGRIANLQPNESSFEAVDTDPVRHPIYRDGKAIFIPFKKIV
ncbi:MAG: type III-A CRISPR-associated RAMP protein Csm4 [Bacteroidota bacterium]